MSAARLLKRLNAYALDQRGAHGPLIAGVGAESRSAVCSPELFLATCVHCGAPFHRHSNRHVRCGTADPPTGCAAVGRRQLERDRQRARRALTPAQVVDG